MKVRWQNQYDKKRPPWDYDKLDPDFQKFFKDYIITKSITQDCKIIDLGCGTGSQVHYIENLGFDIIGTDILNVLEYDINFIIDDVLDSKLSSKYEIIIDRGLIHNLFHGIQREGVKSRFSFKFCSVIFFPRLIKMY